MSSSPEQRLKIGLERMKTPVKRVSRWRPWEPATMLGHERRACDAEAVGGRGFEGTPLTRVRLAFVSAFPPSEGPLSEHGWHLAQSLCHNDRIAELIVLADRAPGARHHTDGKLTVVPCWSFGGVGLPLTAIRMAKRLRVHAVWFNLHMTSTGNTRASNFLGLLAPAATRFAGVPTVVTLHNMLGRTDLHETALSGSFVDRCGAHLATRLVGCAHVVCVTRPHYVDLLRRRYHVRNARYVPLGTPGMPIVTLGDAPRQGILAFGHFGSNKRLEPLFEAVELLARTRPDAHLLIAGTSSRHNTRYLERLRDRYQGRPWVSFLGYVPERDVPTLFQRVAVSVLPYGTTTGMSSVALQSAMYGAPIVASDIPGFRELHEEGLEMALVARPDAQGLASALTSVLDAPVGELRARASRNLEYCRAQTPDLVATAYVDIIRALLA